MNAGLVLEVIYLDANMQLVPSALSLAVSATNPRTGSLEKKTALALTWRGVGRGHLYLYTSLQVIQHEKQTCVITIRAALTAVGRDPAIITIGSH